MYVIVYLVLLVSLGSSAQNVTDLLKGVATYKDCFTSKDPTICLKERALIALNETIMDDRPIVVGFLEIQKNPDYFAEKNDTEILPPEGSQRSIMLSDALVQKVQDFFKSRTVRVNLSNAFEARKKGGGGGGGGGGKSKGMMMAVAGMAAVAVNMVMGKMMVMAGSALMIAKIALLLSIIMIIKKMQEKGGGEEKHVVYADSGHGGGGGGYGGGGGGWHRSIDDPQNLVYKQWAQAASSTENGSDDGFFYFRKTSKTW
nr:unnamed protein product [Callosobruchus chinensis]